MSETYEEITPEVGNTERQEQSKIRTKRDIFRFNGETPTAINLEHVTSMSFTGKRITFSFYTNQIYVDLGNDDAAKTCFEQLLNIWASGGNPDVLA